MSEPCQCHNSHAAVIPFHSGHCCFYPETQDCHPDAVVEWVAEHERRP